MQKESAVVKADGTVQLPAASAIFGMGSALALSIWSLASSAVHVQHGGQVRFCDGNQWVHSCSGCAPWQYRAYWAVSRATPSLHAALQGA